MSNWLREGMLKDGEICPGMTWEDHVDSVAMFFYGYDYTFEQAAQIMDSVKGEMTNGITE